jgi:PKD repeat protein
VIGGANVAPVAAFTATTSGLTVSVDGSTSADPDGTIAAHAWDFGDTATGSGATASHTYAAAGTYTVRLTVTDNRGLTGTTTRSVTVASPPPGPAVLAADTFARTVSGGLGTADVGGPWTVSAGGIRPSVAPGAATRALTGGGNLTASFLGGVSQTGSDVTTSVALSAAPTGGGVSYYVTGRRVGVNLEYRARVRFTATGAVFVGATRLDGTASEVVLGEAQVPGLTYTPGTVLQVRIRVVGTAPTQLAVTAWPAASPEPATPSVVRADSTASLQAAGGFALSAYLSASATAPVNVRVSAFRAVNAP